jgi:uncharacterized protein (DUF169 family)
MTAAARISDLLDLRLQPVAVKFQDKPPEGIPHVDQVALSGCTYWIHAAKGRTFYTEASDHFGCPVGSYTHGIDLPEETAKQLEGLVGTMVQLKYIRMDEVPAIPRRDAPFGVAIYGPASEAKFEPDVILVAGTARQIMLLAEAAQAAGIASDTSMVGRPTCAAIPAVMRSGGVVVNLGCIGNRVYTDLPDDELYFCVAGGRLETLVKNLETIVQANHELEKFHRSRVA